MNILIDELPKEVEIDGIAYKICPNFRNIILAEQTITTQTLSDNEKIMNVLDLFYEDIPQNIEEATKQFSDFISLYRNDKKAEEQGGAEQKSTISTEHDAVYIYTAFLRTYGIDLNNIKFLHWFKFRSMLEDLHPECKLVKIMEYRSVNLADIKDKNMKAYYRKMKKLYAIPAEKEVQTHMDALREALKNGGNVSEILNN